MSARIPTCPAPNCGLKIPRTMFACRAHWYSLPKPLRDRLWSAYQNEGVLSDEYFEAAEACRSYLEGAAA